MQANKTIDKGFFITGTDTNVGKTLIAAAISKALIDRGKKTISIKPVASGCFVRRGKLYSADALILKKHSSNNELPYSAISPFTFREPVAPHIAAKKNGIKLSVLQIISKSHKALTNNDDYIIIEGAGGWLTPINDQETMADLAKSYGYPVILVAGIRLGCINHTLLTYKCMQDSGVKIAGWIANVIDKKMQCLNENIETIKLRLGAEATLLGVVPYINKANPEKIAECFKTLKKPRQMQKIDFFLCRL